MSLINLIVVDKNKLYFAQMHYRYVLNLMKQNFKNIELIKHFVRQKYYLDAGYLLVDMNEKTVISNQDGFSISHLPKQSRQALLKEWNYVDNFR